MIYNKSNNSIIIKKSQIADNFFLKFKGLMFEQKKNFDYGLIFKLNSESRLNAAIHMLFVFFPIDVIFLNKNKSVVDLKENLKPFTLLFIPKKASKYLIEFPVGIIKNAGINIGTKIEWNSADLNELND